MASSVTRFVEISPFGKIFKVLDNFLRVYLLFGKILDRLWQMLHAIGQVFIDINGQMLKNNLFIRSHWWRAWLTERETNIFANVE